MAGSGIPFEEGTWWYNQGRSSYETGAHQGKYYFRKKQEGGDIWGELQPHTSIDEAQKDQWHWRVTLSDGSSVRLRCDGDRMVTSHLRLGAFEWRPPITARRGPKEETAQEALAPKPVPAQASRKPVADAKEKEEERMRSPALSFQSAASRIERIVRGAFLEPEVDRNVLTGSDSTALSSALNKALQTALEMPGRVFDRMTRMPLARFHDEAAMEDHQDELAERKRSDPKKTIVPVPAVRLCPGMLHPVSLNEEQMLRLFINAPLDMSYNLSNGQRQIAPLDIRAAQMSQLMITSRHDVLRSAYRMDDYGNPARKVEREHQGDQFILCVKDYGDCQGIQGAEFSIANALGVSSLRFNIEISGDGWNHQGFNLNHIMGDADAMATYWREHSMIQMLMAQGYSDEAVLERLPPLPVSMVDYAYWQRSLVCQGLLEPDVAVWWSDISSAHPPVVLDTPIDIPRRRAWVAMGSNYFCHLSGDLIQILQEVNYQATPFAVVTAAFSIILSRFSCNPTIYMGTPFALRMLASLQNLIGDFVNMVIFKVSHRPGETFSSILDRTAASAVNVQRYAMAPFLLFVNSLQRHYVTNDPSRNAIYQTMVDVVPKEDESPNPSMSGILDLFLFANTYRGQLWSIECTSNNTILEMQTVRSMLLMMPVLIRAVSRDTKVGIPRSMPFPEEATLANEGRHLLLTHLRLKVGMLPHIVGVASGWECEGEPVECNAIRAARRIKAQSGLQLSADLPLAGARAQRPPFFVVKMELQIQEQMVRQQEAREKRKQQAAEKPAVEKPKAEEALQIEGPEESSPALPVVPAAPEEPAEDPVAAVMAEIEERRAQARRTLAARAAAKGRQAEAKSATEVVGFDVLGPPPLADKRQLVRRR